MTAAILQGVPATTLDADLWIDLPARQYIRIPNLCRKLGATVIANTVVSLADETLVNFVYRVDGLRSFEYKAARQLEWLGLRVRVLPIERVYASKKFISRRRISHTCLSWKQPCALAGVSAAAIEMMVRNCGYQINFRDRDNYLIGL